MPSPQSSRRPALGIILTLLFALTLLMGPGPGVNLVNSAVPLFGYPRVYVWGLIWYVVQMVVVVLAYRFVWTDGKDS